MEILIWPALALLAFAVLLRIGKQRDRIDWKSRGSLLLLSTVVCVLLDRWIRISALNAAEAAATAGVVVDSLAVTLASRYQPVLLPLYIAVIALLIDLLARVSRQGDSTRAYEQGRILSAWRTLVANALLFIGAPALLYAWTAHFASSGSLIDDAARDVLMPVLAAYGAPAYWLQVASTDGWMWHRMAEATWPWNPSYRPDSHVSLYSFLIDCLPWLLTTVLMSCARLVSRNALDTRSLIDYFATPRSSSEAGLLARIAVGPWRGRAAFAFTVLWTAPLGLWLSLVVLTLSLTYVLLWLIAVAIVAALAALINLVIRRSKARAP